MAKCGECRRTGFTIKELEDHVMQYGHDAKKGLAEGEKVTSAVEFQQDYLDRQAHREDRRSSPLVKRKGAAPSASGVTA
jgi:hypothetical protein